MIQGFACLVYRVFLITVYVKSSLLEINYISFEYSQFSDREKTFRFQLFFSNFIDVFQSYLEILICTLIHIRSDVIHN